MIHVAKILCRGYEKLRESAPDWLIDDGPPDAKWAIDRLSELEGADSLPMNGDMSELLFKLDDVFQMSPYIVDEKRKWEACEWSGFIEDRALNRQSMLVNYGRDITSMDELLKMDKEAIKRWVDARGLVYVKEHDLNNSPVTVYDIPNLMKKHIRRAKEIEASILYVMNNWGRVLSLQKMVSLVLMLLVSPQHKRVVQILQHTGALYQSSHDNYIDFLKRSTEALRKTSTLPSGEKVTYQEVASLAYIEFSSGRVESVFNAEKEIRNRTTQSVKLEFPDGRNWTEESFDKEFKRCCDDILQQGWRRSEHGNR